MIDFRRLSMPGKCQRIQNMDPYPWTTSNFLKESVSLNMKMYQRSGFEKHILIFIAYVLEGLSLNSELLWDRTPINSTNSGLKNTYSYLLLIPLRVCLLIVSCFTIAPQ